MISAVDVYFDEEQLFFLHETIPFLTTEDVPITSGIGVVATFTDSTALE